MGEKRNAYRLLVGNPVPPKVLSWHRIRTGAVMTQDKYRCCRDTGYVQVLSWHRIRTGAVAAQDKYRCCRGTEYVKVLS
jgi:hypothetical protein